MKIETKYRELCTQKDIAAMLSVSVRTVRSWHKLGCPRVCIGTAQIGKGVRVRYDMDEVKAWLRSRSNGGGRGIAEDAALPVSRGVTFNQAVKEVMA